MKKIVLVLALMSMVCLTGCCFLENKEKAAKVVDDFYSKLKMQDYEGTLDMYHEKWFTVTPREKTAEFLEKVDGKLGKVEDYVLVDWNSQSYVGEGSGNYITLVYEVNRTKYSSQETFTIFNPEGTGKFLILGYNINSMGLI